MWLYSVWIIQQHGQEAEVGADPLIKFKDTRSDVTVNYFPRQVIISLSTWNAICV